MHIVGIDPGIKTGVAAIIDGKVVFVDTATPDSLVDLLSDGNEHAGFLWSSWVAVEFPVVYPGGRSPNPQQLLRLAFQCGQVAEWCRERGANYVECSPAEWGGRVPKRAKHARLQKRFPELNLAAHNEHELDAIGIALWLYTKRMSYE